MSSFLGSAALYSSLSRAGTTSSLGKACTCHRPLTTHPLSPADVNRKDYRAWYGLGQTYELLGEPYYALNYYQRATALRPYDARMWSALATCNEKLKRYVPVCARLDMHTDEHRHCLARLRIAFDGHR